MTTQNICSACSWSPFRQQACRYNSHVKLFYGVSTRGAWSLGSQFILKERTIDPPPTFETRNIRFLQSTTTIPIPDVVQEWREENAHFLLSKRVPGQPLSEAWPNMSIEDKERIAKQTAEYLLQLRGLHSTKMESLGGEPLHCAFLFLGENDLGHGPLSSDDELWAEMSLALSNVPEEVRQHLRRQMPTAFPYTFTHGDLTNVNIMVENGNLTGILDWEGSGYCPVWWEFTCAGIGLGQEDKEWKDLLRKHMPDHTAAREFWLDLHALKYFPDLGERGLELAKRFGLEMPEGSEEK